MLAELENREVHNLILYWYACIPSGLYETERNCEMKKEKQCIRAYALSMAILLLMFWMVRFAPIPVYAASSSEIRNQINALKEEKDEIKEQIAEVQAQYQENENEIANIISRKNVIDQELQLLYAQVENIDQQLRAFNTLIADKQDELNDAEDTYQTLSVQNAVRIRTMEEEGSVTYWEVIFKANSFSDLLDRLNMVAEIAAADERRLQELEDAAHNVESARQELEQEKADLEATKKEFDDAQAEMDAKRKEADSIIQELLTKADDLEALEAAFEEQEAEFLKEIASKELEYDAAKQAEWEAYMATYVPPTTQPIATDSGTSTESGTSTTGTSSGTTWLVPCSYTSITSPFGYRDAPTAGASTYHQGVDLDTGTGWSVVASRAGTAYTAYSSSAGNYVTIDHHDGFRTVYMHLSAFSVSNGTVVGAGQQIGLTGSTGVSTGDHLHFGISLNGVYVNPCLYVNL